MGLGSLCLFTQVVRRTDHRFILPLAFAFSYYVGAGASAIEAAARGRSRTAVRCGLVGLALGCALPCLALLTTQWSDGRRDVVAWLAEQPKGTHVETYGLPVYQPHFEVGADAPYRVTRLQPLTGDPWAPIRGIESVRDRYANVGQRGPDVLVVPEGFAMRYFARELTPGQRLSVQEQRAQADGDAVDFMRRAVRGDLPGYRLALMAESRLPAPLAALGLTPIQIHGSTGLRTWVLLREP
jgi:hypothetical protein